MKFTRMHGLVTGGALGEKDSKSSLMKILPYSRTMMGILVDQEQKGVLCFG
ncbi:MAG: hypothetical protein AAGU75_24920 [Bacillota bacterium]|uniref:hypothetical protein n=1 Tax=Desulfitobacterium hafniense TaxID=49338 RepID=UPI000362C0CD|nr:hypothetical protein [Desulfitobacterium hafniense]